MSSMLKKAAGLFAQIRAVVARIPLGTVVTYGQVAQKVGIRDARKVGWALWGNQDPGIPCHRVVKAGGYLARDYSLGGWQEQKSRLVAEGVTFISSDQVDLPKHLWR